MKPHFLHELQPLKNCQFSIHVSNSFKDQMSFFSGSVETKLCYEYQIEDALGILILFSVNISQPKFREETYFCL